MGLESVDTPHYLVCRRVYVNTDNKDPTRSRSNFDVVVDLAELYTRVQALELVSWMVPFDISPTIKAGVNDVLYVKAIATMGGETVFPPNPEETTTITVPEGAYSAQELADTIKAALEAWLNGIPSDYYNGAYTYTYAQWQYNNTFYGQLTYAEYLAEVEARGGTTHGWGNITVSTVVEVSGAAEGRLFFRPYRSLTVDLHPNAPSTREEPLALQFLFASGATTNRLAWTLGMTPLLDTYLGTANGFEVNGPLGVSVPRLGLYRSVGVFVAGVQHQVAQVPLTAAADFVTRRFVKTRFRLLDKPIRRMDEISVALRFRDGSEPATLSTNGYDLVFDFLLLSPETCVPMWVRQQLGV